MKALISNIKNKFSQRLSLRWRIYILLVAIIVPVFALIFLVQTKLTRPILEEEVRQAGIGICRSLSTEILAFKLLAKEPLLESKLVEASWTQPGLVRIDVILKEEEKLKLLASNIVEESPLDISIFRYDENVHSELKTDDDRKYWEIIYPIKDRKRVLGYIHAEVSLQLVDQVEGTFTKMAFFGTILAIGLLILLLSHYLRRMIENEQLLKQVEFQNLELTEQLHETQRQLFLNEKLAIMGQLTASFAHEIGTPLNSVAGHLQLLKEETKNTSATNRLEVISSQVSRIEGIVKAFLASTHTPHQQRELVDVQTLIERMVKLVAPRAQALKADVRIEMNEKLEPVRVVPTDLEQVLINLTNNALDALASSTNPERQLLYQACCINKPQRAVEILVKDSGDGIPPDVLKQVLKPFFTTKAPGQGTGLGLTISQRFIKKYGGKLELDSALGKGTTVKVNIPYDLS